MSLCVWHCTHDPWSGMHMLAAVGVGVHKSSVSPARFTGIISRNYHFPVVDQLYLVWQMGNELFGVCFSVPHYRSHWRNLIYEVSGNFLSCLISKILSAANFPKSCAKWCFSLRQHRAWQCSLDSSTASIVAKEELMHVLLSRQGMMTKHVLMLSSLLMIIKHESLQHRQDHELLSPLVSSTECSNC